MLEDAFGIAGMNFDMGPEIEIEQRMPEVPNDEATKFYRLLRQYQEPLTTDRTTISRLEIYRPLSHALGKGVTQHLSLEEWEQAHLYVLHNCDELVEFDKEHKLELERETPRNVKQRHKAQFAKWIHERVRKMHEEDEVDIDELLDVDAYQQVEVDVECYSMEQVPLHDILINNLATDAFVVEDEPSVVNLVKEAKKEKEERQLDDDFINDESV
ncbi:hypothetical protein RIF29_13942 [Crotalaria pallida]|uniref:Uncharacterized protein n=1 Tax=Crotalaria pallida TaxID=3830 RepID=A0AAN9FCJ3_CROPI